MSQSAQIDLEYSNSNVCNESIYLQICVYIYIALAHLIICPYIKGFLCLITLAFQPWVRKAYDARDDLALGTEDDNPSEEGDAETEEGKARLTPAEKDLHWRQLNRI